MTVLFTGALVAAIGFVQQFSWNGKILWSFVPYDWGVPRPDGPSRLWSVCQSEPFCQLPSAYFTDSRRLRSLSNVYREQVWKKRSGSFLR